MRKAIRSVPFLPVLALAMLLLSAGPAAGENHVLYKKIPLSE